MGHGSSPDLGAWAGGAGSAVTTEIPLMGAQLLFITCTAKSQVGQQLVPEVPDAWASLAGDGEEGDRRAVEEEVFFLSLVEEWKGELPCSAVLLLCHPRGGWRDAGGRGHTEQGQHASGHGWHWEHHSPQDHKRFPAMLTWEQLGTGVQPLDAP